LSDISLQPTHNNAVVGMPLRRNVAVVVVNHRKSNVLIGRITKAPHETYVPHQWSLVEGGVELEDKTILAAVRREMEQEIHVEAADIFHLTTLREPIEYPFDNGHQRYSGKQNWVTFVIVNPNCIRLHPDPDRADGKPAFQEISWVQPHAVTHHLKRSAHPGRTSFVNQLDTVILDVYGAMGSIGHSEGLGSLKTIVNKTLADRGFTGDDFDVPAVEYRAIRSPRQSTGQAWREFRRKDLRFKIA